MTPARRSWTATAAIVAIAIAVRLVAWQRQPELSYDGTYYLRTAERLARFEYDFIGFPPGYPVAILLLRPLAGDPVRAARLVSAASGIATVALVHRGLAFALPAGWALGAGLFLALHPQAARLDVDTLSDSLYGLLVVAGLVWHSRRRFAASAAILGAAFLVRPEAAAPLAGVTLARALESRHVPWSALAGWLPVLAFAIASSIAVGHPVLSPKQGQLDIEAAGIVSRLQSLANVTRLVFPWVLVPFAIGFAARWRRLWLWVAVPPLVAPLAFAVHVQERLLVAALPFWTVLAAEWLRTAQRRLWVPVVVASVVVFAHPLFYGVRMLVAPEPVSPHARALGTALRPHLGFADRVACRFPMLPYYAGAGFVRPRALPYDALLDTLRAEGATHVAIVEDEMQRALPQLARLFNDAAFATAEGRLLPVGRADTGPGARAVLYRFGDPPIRVSEAVSGARSACFSGDALVAALQDGDLHRIDGGLTTALLQTPEMEIEPQCGQASGRLVFCQVRDGERWIASLDRAGRLSAWPQTAGDLPASPSDAGTHIVYVRTRAPAALCALDVATGRIAAVALAGLDDDAADPLAVTVAGRNVAITYRRHGATNPSQRIVATAVWPERPGPGTIVLAGGWAVGLALAEDGVCWAPGEDAVVVTTHFASRNALHSTLAVVRRNASLRRLTFGQQRTRRACLGPEGRIAYLRDDATLEVGSLAAGALTTPAPLVFAAANP